ncbi:MAG: NnrS family protein [Ramlibacter sp.]|nr:NnrS family protein [Ramlibacter sp.]
MSVGSAAAPPSRAWHWRHLLQAPHRLGFFLAMVVLLAAGLWWAAVQLQRSGAGLDLPYAVSPSLVHAAVMTFGFMPLFFSGFLFTAGPKWLRVSGPSARRLAPALLAQVAGWFAWLAGSHVHAAFAATGLSLVVLGLGGMTAMFWRLIAASREEDRMHARVVGAALVVGCVCLAGVGASVLTGAGAAARLFTLTGLWGFIVVVFVTVAHRMIPFFSVPPMPTVQGWRPSSVLALMLGVAAFEACAGWLDAAFPGDAAWQVVRGVLELGAGAVLLWLAVLWGLFKSLRVRLLAMLHLGFLWLGLGLALGGASQLLGRPSGSAVLPLAPLHAITMGALGSLMLAMVTRVSCGHAGRSVVADDLMWSLFWLLQAATLLRIAAAVPSWPVQPLLTAAALLWAVLMLIWGLRYGSWYGRPRADGRPG